MPDENPNGGGNAVLLKEFIPQELHDREYMKPWLDKPWDKATAAEFFKKHDGIESLLGKRPAIPDPKTSKPEEIEAFLARYAEEKPEGYEIPLEKDAKVNPDFVKAVQTAFHAGKISKVQAQGFLKVINEFGAAQRKAAAEKQARADAEFDTLAKTMLGPENKAKMENAKKLLAQYAPAAASDRIAKLDDTNLLILAAVVNAVHEKFSSTDDLGGKGKGGNGGSGSGGDSVAEKRETARALIAEIAKMKPMDPNIEKKQAEVNRLYREIAEATA